MEWSLIWASLFYSNLIFSPCIAYDDAVSPTVRCRSDSLQLITSGDRANMNFLIYLRAVRREKTFEIEFHQSIFFAEQYSSFPCGW